MSSRALYRSLVPAHSSVADDTVDAMLELAARRHTVSAWGRVYPEAMVWWAAHRVERTPGLVSGSGSASETGTITSQRDGDLSRSYAAPSTSGMTASDAELQTTRYGQLYLELRSSRAASAPTAVRP